MLHRLFSIPMISRTVGILIITGIFFYCQSEKTGKHSGATKSANVAEQKQNNGKTTEMAQNDSPQKQNRKLIVYYFHTNFRCHSCTTIEQLTRQAVKTGFADQLKNGRMELKVINVEEPGNEHFVDDYKLYTKSVILSDVNNGSEATWKNCEKVWTLLGEDQKFIDYIQSEVKTLL